MLSLLGMIEQQVMIVLLIAVGFFLSRTGYIEHNVRLFLSFININVLIPCSLFTVLVTAQPNEEQLYDFFLVVLIGFVVEGLCFWAAKYLFRNFPIKQKNILRYALTSPNVAFIGLPIIDGYYGNEGILYLAAFMIPLNFFMFLFSFRLFLPKEKARIPILKQIMHPTLISIFIGLAFMLLGLQPPSLLLNTAELLAHCSVPMALLPIGCILASIDMRATLFTTGFLLCGLRLLIIPLLVLGISWVLGIPAIVAGVLTLLFGMPVAVTTNSLATAYKGDVVYSSKLIFLSTVISMLTLPLLATIVELLFMA